VLSRLAEAVVNLVDEFHAQDPLAPGVGKESLREQGQLSAEILDAVLSLAVGNKQLAVAGDLVHRPGRGVIMKDEEAESRNLIEQAFRSAGLKVPSLKQVLAGLRIDRRRAEKIVTLLLRDKVLVKVADDLLFHHSALAQLRTSLASQRAHSPRIDVAAFKDLAGISRKYAIPLLEYLDRERVTRREGDARIIL
jgi:selenocysteine-specific elongation factor